MNKMKKLTMLALFIFIVGLATACGTNKEEPKKPEATTKTTETGDGGKGKTDNNAATGDKQAGPKLYKVGEVVEIEGYKLTVHGIRTLTQDKSGALKAEEGKEFLLVDCTVENTSNEEKTVSSMMMFKVVDKDGAQYQQELFTDANGQLDGNIGAGRKIKGEYAAQVPKGKNGLELVFESYLANNQQVIVELR